MTVAVIYSLFGDDFKMAMFDKSYDYSFDTLSLMALMLFAFEIVIVSIVNPGYIFGFYFCLDVISTLSMVAEISFLWNYISGTEGDFTASNAQQAHTLAKA
jgi:hypothetical protein